jgi:LysM repeat protein
MKPVLWIPASCAFVLALTSCGNSGGSSGSQQSGTGPFDRNGRYVEEWADNPSKWRKAGKAPSPHELKTDEVPEIAQSEQPPQNANPLAPTRQSKPAPVISQTQVTTQPKPSVKTTTTTTTVKPKPVAVTTAKPKPKPVVKAKPKPKSTRYVVKKGDSLSAIASRTGSSVSAIKSANGISGTLIRPGQSLTIPKK